MDSSGLDITAATMCRDLGRAGVATAVYDLQTLGY